MMKSAQLDAKLFVGPQIEMADLAKLKSLGYSTIISNRPDGESAGQLLAAELEKAAAELGMTFVHLPLGLKDEISGEMVAAFDRAVARAEGKVMAFCRTGTRSTKIWALTQIGRKSVNEILGAAGAAGFDISAMRDRICQTQEVQMA